MAAWFNPAEADGRRSAQVWVLRTVLLLQAGLDATTLQAAYELSSAYNHITNTRNLLADGPYATH